MSQLSLPLADTPETISFDIDRLDTYRLDLTQIRSVLRSPVTFMLRYHHRTTPRYHQLYDIAHGLYYSTPYTPQINKEWDTLYETLIMEPYAPYLNSVMLDLVADTYITCFSSLLDPKIIFVDQDELIQQTRYKIRQFLALTRRYDIACTPVYTQGLCYKDYAQKIVEILLVRLQQVCEEDPCVHSYPTSGSRLKRHSNLSLVPSD